MSKKVDLSTIKAAAEIIKGVARRTPIVDCPALADEFGGEVFLKLENLQKTGSFKIRGAINKIASLTEEEKAQGVIAASAGNHAQGVALGARAKGIKATIAMPATAPMAKVSATRGYGAEVVLSGAVYDDAYAKAVEIQKETGATFLHPFDDAFVISGQGTIGLEILEDLENVDVIVTPIGGGGIAAGIATAAKALKPSVKVIGVQTSNVASMPAALKAGESVVVDATPTIADGIAVRKAGTLTFELVKEFVDEVVTVSEDEIATSILYMMEKNKIVAEGAGATAFAAILAGKIDTKGKKVCAVVSGGNVDVNLVDRIINRALIVAGRRFEFTTIVADKAGEIQKILAVVSEGKANVLSICSSRYESCLGINSQELSLVIECLDMNHKIELTEKLENSGYKMN
ncbi:MAG: threonine ammonia-lyase [Fusobacteriaceae bacterium]